MIKIVGAQGNIQTIDNFLDKISDFCRENSVIVEVFNADLIYEKQHLLSAVEHAQRAIKRKTNTTNSFEMEILLYASGERQLKLAIPKMGVKKGDSKIAIAIVDSKKDIIDEFIDKMLKHLSLKRDDKVLHGNINILKKFGITKQEIKTVKEDKYQDLILEKIAMVDIIK